MGKPEKDRGNGAETGETDLAGAAVSLEAELRRYEDLAAAIRRIPLSSQKNIEKAAHAVQEANESQRRVGTAIASLVSAITSVRDRHLATAEGVGEQAQRIAERSQEVNTLVQRYAALGEQAKQIGAIVAQAAQLKGRVPTPEEAEGVSQSLKIAQEKMGEVAEIAAELAREAREKDVDDVAREADALRQQIQAAKNKLHLVEKALLPS